MSLYDFANGDPVNRFDPDGRQDASAYALMGIGGAGMSGWANPQSAQALGNALAAAQRAGYDVNKVASAGANAEFSRNLDKQVQSVLAGYAIITGGVVAGEAAPVVWAATSTEAAVIGRVTQTAFQSAATDIAEMSVLMNTASIEVQAMLIARAPWLIPAATASLEFADQAAPGAPSPFSGDAAAWGWVVSNLEDAADGYTQFMDLIMPKKESPKKGSCGK